MDKLTIATQVLLKLIETDKTGFDAEGIAGYAWEITDAMQAEADKRKPSGLPEALKEEWQPDWSQAPGNMNWFSIDKDGTAAWYIDKPTISATEWIVDYSDRGGDCYMYTSNFGYTGNWQNSLRKRPQ